MKTTYLPVLKNKEFLKLWGGLLLSVITANMLNFVLIGRVFEATGSAVAIGLLWAFYVFPTAVLGPFSGVFLDFLNKKKILILSSFVQAFVVLLYLGVGKSIWLVYTILLLYSFCDEFFMPATAVLLPSIVKKKELAAANSLFMFTVNGSIILGFLVGGLMLKFLGFSSSLFFTASVFLILAAVLSSLLKWKEPEEKEKPEVSLASFFKELVEGYKFIRSETRVLFPMLLLGGLQVILGMGLILLPSIAKEILEISFADSSYFVLVPVVLGAVLGSVVVERLIHKHLKRVLIINGLFLLGFTLLVTGLALVYLWPKVLLGVIFCVLMGLAFTMIMIPLQVLVQTHTPFKVRGRVFGTLNTLITLAAAIPVLATVSLVDFLGVRLVISIMGFGLIILAYYANKGKYGIISNHHRS